MPPRCEVVTDAGSFTNSLAQGPLAGHDWGDRLRTIRDFLESNPTAGEVTHQDRDVYILYFGATPARPGMKVFYKVEGATVTLLLARPFDGTQDAEEI